MYHLRCTSISSLVRALDSFSNSLSCTCKLNRLNERISTGRKQLTNQPYRFNRLYSTKTVKNIVIPKDSLLESLTPEETNKVLNVVNEVQRSEDLLKYIIPKKKADELIKFKSSREDNSGGISSLEELILVVGPKNSSKFICSVLNKPIPIAANSAMFPVVSKEDIQKISTALSLVIVGDKISWSVISRNEASDGDYGCNLHVKTLQQTVYPFKPRMHFLTLLEEMAKIAKEIPEADLYITEEYPATTPTPYMFNFQLQMGQAKSMLLGFLKSRAKSSMIISIKTVSVARLFNTYVGSERVSGQHIVENMCMNNANPAVDWDISIMKSYPSLDSAVKEGLSHTFLLNLAYWKLTKQVR